MTFTRKMAGLTWDMCRSSVSSDVIDKHERALGVLFPDDFRAVIQVCPGGHPLEREEFWIDHPAHGRLGSGLGALMTLEPLEDVNGMLFAANALHEHHGVPRHIIPIARDGGGDFMCLDYGESAAHPTVVYYSHEAPIDESFAYLADSFSAFLAMLEPIDDDQDERDEPARVPSPG